MKYLISLFIIMAVLSCEKPAPDTENISIVEDNLDAMSDAHDYSYDSAFAASLGADDYGMKQYVMAFLKKGPNQSQDSAEAVRIQRAHLDNIKRMAEEGKLIMAGPFMDDSEIRGIYVFNVKTLEEARELTSSDPAVKAGRLEMELHPWYGSAVLQELSKMHGKVQKESI